MKFTGDVQKSPFNIYKVKWLNGVVLLIINDVGVAPKRAER